MSGAFRPQDGGHVLVLRSTICRAQPEPWLQPVRGPEPTNPHVKNEGKEIRNLCLLDFGKRLLGLAFS